MFTCLLLFLAPCCCVVSCKTGLMRSSWQKKDIIEKLLSLPHDGDSFTADAIQKAGPYLPVILSFTEGDLAERGTFGVGMLLAGLLQREENCAYVLNHFEDIQHPELKVTIGAALFYKGLTSPAIIKYLQSMLNDEKQGAILADMLGKDVGELRSISVSP
jgi:hypothetical protein